MKFVFDADTDVLTIQFRDSKLAKNVNTTRELGDNIMAGFDNKGNLDYVQLQKASIQYPVLKTFIAQAGEFMKLKDALGKVDQYLEQQGKK